MSNKEVEKTIFVDMQNIALEAGIEGDDKWLNFSESDVRRCIDIIDKKIARDNPDVVQLTGKFPIEVSLSLGAHLSQYINRLEYCRPGISRKVIFDYESCPEMRT